MNSNSYFEACVGLEVEVAKAAWERPFPGLGVRHCVMLRQRRLRLERRGTNVAAERHGGVKRRPVTLQRRRIEEGFVASSAGQKFVGF